MGSIRSSLTSRTSRPRSGHMSGISSSTQRWKEGQVGPTFQGKVNIIIVYLVKIIFVSDNTIRMLSVLKAQVTNLDSSKYKVMLVWDPDNARDIGWLTVEKDRKVDLEALQIRDVNLNKINLSSKSEPEPSNPNNESEGNIVNSNASLTFGVDNQEVIMIEDDVMEDSALHEAENMKMSVVNDADPGCKGKAQCPECKIMVNKKSFPPHMARIHGKKFVKSEQVKCEICSVRVNKVNLKFHMKLKHSILTKCEDCGKTFKSYKGLSSHKRFCKKARNNEQGKTPLGTRPTRSRSATGNVSLSLEPSLRYPGSKTAKRLAIRRSERKPKAELLKEQMEIIEARLLDNDDTKLGIKVAYIENKGRGIKVWIVIRSWIYSKIFIFKGCERFRQGRIRRRVRRGPD